MYKNYAKIALSIIGIFTLICLYFVTTLRFDYDFEKMFPLGDPDLEYFYEFREKFGNDNDYLLLGIKNEQGIFNKDFLNRLDSLTNQISRLDDVEKVLSPTNLKNPVVSPAGLFQLPVLHVHQPERYKDDSVLIYKDPGMIRSFFSEDGKSVALLIQHTQMIKKDPADALTKNIESLTDYYHFDQAHLAGKAKAFGVYIDIMQTELMIFMGISFILVVIFLALTYRSVIGVIVPLIVVLLATLGILGIMGMMNKALDVMMVLLPTIMFVVGMSDVVHIQTKYIEELRNGANKIKALKTTFKEVGLATLLTSVTTAAGFLTLTTASISPIREFGFFTAMGVFMAFIMAFALLPSVLLFSPLPPIAKKQQNKAAWTSFMHWSFTSVIRYRKEIVAVCAALLLVSFYGIYQIKLNTYILEDLSDKDPMKQGFAFFEEEMGGARPFEMTVWVKDSSKTVYDRDVLPELEKIETFLQEEYGVSNIISPVFQIKTLHKALNGGLPQAYKLPDEDFNSNRMNKILQILEKRNTEVKVSADQKQTARISGKMADVGSAVTVKLNEKFDRFFTTHINSELFGYKMTGTSFLIDKNTEYLTMNMVQGLLIAFGVIALIVGMMFKSVKMVIITLVPNLIPLVFIAGIMGYFDISLKVTTSIIFTIAFGIAVDDTIHFISKLKIELNKGKSMLYALKRTYFSTGKAIIVTTIILIGGFLTLILSSFGGTFYTGLLVSLTLLFAVIIDLTLLPVLLILFYQSKSQPG
jgi:uncharacterized protein